MDVHFSSQEDSCRIHQHSTSDGTVDMDNKKLVLSTSSLSVSDVVGNVTGAVADVVGGAVGDAVDSICMVW